MPESEAKVCQAKPLQLAGGRRRSAQRSLCVSWALRSPNHPVAMALSSLKDCVCHCVNICPYTPIQCRYSPVELCFIHHPHRHVLGAASRPRASCAPVL